MLIFPSDLLATFSERGGAMKDSSKMPLILHGADRSIKTSYLMNEAEAFPMHGYE